MTTDTQVEPIHPAALSFTEAREFGSYRVERKIAAGGMAEIYLARQEGIEGLERTVVIKRILPTLANNDEFVTMFLDEARLLAALSHPNIAQVFDLGRHQNSFYLVMEYIRGPTLGKLLQCATNAGANGLPEREALTIALQVAEALDHVHSRRDEFGRPLHIVHRDLNPANVLVSYDGAVKLIDFGIAKAATKLYETRIGVIKGTYGYIAPEQLTLVAPVDHRADVFGLGVLLYEMCVGRHPFDDPNANEKTIRDRVLGAVYPRPRQIVPTISPVLERIITRCLAPRPEGRPENVATLVRELSAHMGERGIVPTMSQVSNLVCTLVPDTEGAVPLKPLRSSVAGIESSTPTAIALEPSRSVDTNDQTLPLKNSRDPSILTAIEVPMLGETLLQAEAKLEPIFETPPEQQSKKKMWISATLGTLVVLGATALFFNMNAAGLLSQPISGDRKRFKVVTPKTSMRSLVVTSDPPGASVAINGQEFFVHTPATIRTAASDAWIRASLPGYLTQEQHAGPGNASVFLKLQPLPTTKAKAPAPPASHNEPDLAKPSPAAGAEPPPPPPTTKKTKHVRTSHNRHAR